MKEPARLRESAKEETVTQAWARGELSPDEAFVRLYQVYAPLVRTWLASRAGSAADDLSQDVWTIFYRRCGEWKHRREHDDAGARPVLSFLFRTSHLVLRAHRRLQANRPAQGLDGVADPAVDGQSSADEAIQLGQCLSAARLHCSDEDYAVLTAKLAGVPAREIGRTLQLTEATVDHRYRNAVERIREALSPRVRNVHV
jgi:DNA-directed RNA polymerase specialized sigma24 family protein